MITDEAAGAQGNLSAGLSLERALVIVVLSLLIWLPLPLASHREWSSALFVFIVALASAIWSIRLLRSRAACRISTLRAALPLFALLVAAQAWVAAQWLAGISVDTGATCRDLILGCGYTLLFLLITGLFYTRRRVTLLLAVLTISGLLQAFYGSLMTLSHIDWLAFGPKETGQGDVTGTFVNRNHLAGYLEMTLACGLGLLMALRDGRPFSWLALPDLLIGPKMRIRLALAIMVIALVMSHSRMGNSAFFTGLILLGGLFTLVHRQHRLRNGLILVSLLLIDLLIISQFFGLDKLEDRLLETQFEDQVVNGQVVRHENVDRDDIVRYALPQLRERPFIGFGAGAFETSFPRFPGPDIRSHFDHAHNDVLEFAIEFGLIGLTPLALFVLWSFAMALKALWRRDSLYRSGVGLGAGIGILAIGIHSLSDFNLQIPANAATFVTLCAIAVLANHHHARIARVGERDPDSEA
ncbi:O-antigen ligase family protein [uncultured Thiodictyon sp.]|uniref:O-antigen ligase family protein n=1 Tax=uncultured Thiodictyon sp. TaxID=1846217 RepID=UPI0025F1AFEB|nr:O-antigen ligase family protein [uncultured Thiodictyon sp.]